MSSNGSPLRFAWVRQLCAGGVTSHVDRARVEVLGRLRTGSPPEPGALVPPFRLSLPLGVDPVELVDEWHAADVGDGAGYEVWITQAGELVVFAPGTASLVDYTQQHSLVHNAEPLASHPWTHLCDGGDCRACSVLGDPIR